MPDSRVFSAGDPPKLRLRRVRRSARIGIAVVTAVTLATTITGQASEAVVTRIDQAKADVAWKPAKERSVNGTNAKVAPRAADPAQTRAITEAPAVHWPTAGKASVAVPAFKSRPTDWGTVLRGDPARALPASAARAGRLPIAIGATAAGAARTSTPKTVEVDLVGRRDASVVFGLRRVDGRKAAGPVSVHFDYSSFRNAFGADWASRLRMVDLSTGKSVPTQNDGSGVLSAEVTPSAERSEFAVQAAPSGPSGDHKASALSPSATWQVGGSSGDFGWSYPMDVPPGSGGPSIDLALSYSSGSVDGKTSATNNQPSWAGEGFDFAPGGSIERRYASCGSKSEQNGNNGTRTVGDLCWATDNATFSLLGGGGELIRDDATGKWRPAADDGSTVERLTGAANGDDNGEYWVITSKDGTKYYFGLNRLTGWVAGNPETQSTWTVPVFGNNAGEPCNSGSFANSHCQQAYKWNLDYVVDRHGNTMSFFYDVETNYYARNFSAGSVSKYVRAGNLKHIEYGQRDGQVYTEPATARVVTTSADRCLPGSACTTSQPGLYPDTPLDQQCNSSTNCENKYSPTFWTQKRLAKVTTEVWRGTGFAAVESWTLRHSFPDPGDGTRAGLWLAGLTNAGLVNGTVTAPEINFVGVQLPNRVNNNDNLPAMNWWRISTIHYGTGGELAVAYSAKDCGPGNFPAPDTNGKRCHPAKWTPEGQSERQDWFNKFVVTQVSESDRVSGLEPVVTKVEYLTPPAWRHDDEDGLVEIGKKTWSQWRGYERVRVTKGHPSGTQSVTENRFHRGMDGDKLANGNKKDIWLTDSVGGRVEDVNALAGQLREQLVYDGADLVDRRINDRWISAPRATRVKPWGTSQAFLVEDASVREETIAGAQSRRRTASNTYNAVGAITHKNELNDVAKSDDDTCTRYTYGENPAVGLSELLVREHTVAKACDQPWTTADVLADTRTEYDGGGTPIKGDITKVEQVSGYDQSDAPILKTIYSASYDTVGRRIRLTDAEGKSLDRTFTPATTGPVTKFVVTASNGQTETTELDPAWGEPLSVTRADGGRTQTAYDPMGRTEQVWLPGRSLSDQPNFAYEYLMRADGANAVRTTTLQANGASESTIELTDGLLRPRQTQEAAPGGGRRVTDYVYDSRGELVKENGPYYNSAPPGDEVLIPVESELPLQKITSFDGAERPTVEIVKSGAAEKWRTTHTHGLGAHTIQPPAGEMPVMRITDVEGRLTELRQFTGATPTGAYDSTTYTYHRSGQLASVQDPAGNRWTFEYDLRGRKVKESDPDKGTTTYTYNDLGQIVTGTDAEGRTLAYDYDDLGRKTSIHEGNLQGPKRAEWTYDTLAKGALTSATRFIDGQAYTTQVSGYDTGGRPLGTEIVLPEREGVLAGTYAVKSTYNADGEVATTELPGVGGLPEETLRFGYNDQDLPTTLTGASSYVTGTDYTPYGELETLTLSQGGGKWVRQLYEYESGTRRLSRLVTERETLPRRISSLAYSYDQAGNVKQITNTPSASSGEATDTQCFGYDHLRRLTDAWTPSSNNCAGAPDSAALGGPAPYWHSWTFDKTGNRLSETKRTAGSTTTSAYEYPAAGQAQPHAVQKVTTDGPTGTRTNTYGYDKTGNLTKRDLAGTAETLSWDVEGELESVSKGGQTTSFVYDAGGNRVLRRDSSGTTFYFGQTELLLKPSGEVSGTRYYEHARKTVAIRVGDDVTWLGNDHHGTPELAVKASDQTFQRRRTTPYGEQRGAAPASWPGQKGFVGGVNDASTGLVHLRAREYDPTIGKFISVDPIADYEDPQQLNGYAYANNRPTTSSDPDGRFLFGVVVVFRMFFVRAVVKIPSAVPVQTPVLRTQSIMLSILGLFHRVVRTWIEMVIRVITILKSIPVTARIFKPVIIRTLQPDPPPVQAAKKPSSQAKAAAKPQVRNAPTAVKPKLNSTPPAGKTGSDGPPRQPPVSRGGTENPEDDDNEAKGGVYSLRDPQNPDRVMRTGRTKDLARRKAEHARDPKLSAYEFKVEYRSDNYFVVRGLEQYMHLRHRPPLNYVAGISGKNKNYNTYMRAALDDFLRNET
ncbi:RHS repeat-associated core domain-containing protein [Kribbella sp. NPDC056951]|uniref:RHS repeat-associated core domain-containing protein n=1 Tax=Kribbella sp. NPDC056951 TaxID=3345978 RepID=UPI0036375EC0